MSHALRQAQAGEEAGFLTLWRELQPPLLRYLRLRAGDAGEDVAGEVWLHVVRDLRGFRGDADDFRAWLFTVARNRAIDAARAAASRPSVTVGDPSVLVTRQDHTESAEAAALEAISTRRALELVATLPPDQAEMVALRVIAGLDVERVATIVGRSRGAVRVAVHRGLRTLAGRSRIANPPTETSDQSLEVI